MDEILNLSIDRMAGLSFACSCGKNHSVGIKKIVVEEGAVNRTAGIAAEFAGNGRMFLTADANTYRVCGERVKELLTGSGLQVKTCVFDGPGTLVPDERALGRLFMEIERDTSLIVAVGSGTLNDLSRFVASRLNVPYMIVATAPSMDGYASVISPLIIQGFKKTFEAVGPCAIVADTAILREAPVDMIRAGFGDILGKLTSLSDWDLARRLNNEDYCNTSAELIRRALERCISAVDGIEQRDEKTIRYITEALILSGVAIGLIGNSRPASGAEHHMAHYWEMDALAKHEEHPLHGNAVGVGAVLISMLYEMARDRLPSDMDIPSSRQILELLQKAGSCSTPQQLGIGRELLRESLLHAKEIRPRYTLFSALTAMGLLEDYAEQLTRRFYA